MGRAKVGFQNSTAQFGPPNGAGTVATILPGDLRNTRNAKNAADKVPAPVLTLSSALDRTPMVLLPLASIAKAHRYRRAKPPSGSSPILTIMSAPLGGTFLSAIAAFLSAVDWSKPENRLEY
jgi:hypothetical protein